MISAGMRPNIKLGLEAGIKAKRGIVVDGRLQTSAKDVYAIGDVAEFEGTVYGIIPAAFEQARIAAADILGKKHTVYAGTIPSNKLDQSGQGEHRSNTFSRSYPTGLGST